MLAPPKLSPTAAANLDVMIDYYGIRTVLVTIAGICEARAEKLDGITPGNSAAERWAQLAAWVDLAAGRAAKL